MQRTYAATACITEKRKIRDLAKLRAREQIVDPAKLKADQQLMEAGKAKDKEKERQAQLHQGMEGLVKWPRNRPEHLRM